MFLESVQAAKTIFYLKTPFYKSLPGVPGYLKITCKVPILVHQTKRHNYRGGSGVVTEII